MLAWRIIWIPLSLNRYNIVLDKQKAPRIINRGAFLLIFKDLKSLEILSVVFCFLAAHLEETG